MATYVAHAFFDTIVRFHDVPSSIVSDRDPVFTSKFWSEQFTLAGVKLNLTMAFLPQFDGQSEVANKVFAMYLHCFAGDRSRQWLQWLPWTEYCYNTSFHSSLHSTPFKVIYDQEPPSLRAYTPGKARLPVVHPQLMEHDEFICQVWERLEQVHNHYKLQYDCNHQELEFNHRDWVWLHLLHRPITSFNVASRGKLSPKFYGPFQVHERVGNLAYKLVLPSGAKLHDTFHVRVVHQGRSWLEPIEVIKSRLTRGRCELLIRWTARWQLMPLGWNSMISNVLTLHFSSRRANSLGREKCHEIQYQLKGNHAVVIIGISFLLGLSSVLLGNQSSQFDRQAIS
jgi:hypothetical protein